MPDITKSELQHWREVCEKATDGPWTRCSASDGKCACGLIWAGHQNDTVARTYSGEHENHGRHEDGIFIALARTALPRAIERISTLERLCREACGIARDLNGDMGDDEEMLRRNAEISAILAAVEGES